MGRNVIVLVVSWGCIGRPGNRDTHFSSTVPPSPTASFLVIWYRKLITRKFRPSLSKVLVSTKLERTCNKRKMQLWDAVVTVLDFFQKLPGFLKNALKNRRWGSYSSTDVWDTPQNSFQVLNYTLQRTNICWRSKCCYNVDDEIDDFVLSNRNRKGNQQVCVLMNPTATGKCEVLNLRCSLFKGSCNSHFQMSDSD